LVHVPLGGLGVPLRPQDRGLTRSFRELEGMVFDVKPMVFSSRDVGGEFVGKIFVTGMLPKLNASTPYNGWNFGGRLRFYTEEMAEKIQWGSIPRKASQKWMKIAIWKIEFGLR
jgi:hypothetical protein